MSQFPFRYHIDTISIFMSKYVSRCLAHSNSARKYFSTCSMVASPLIVNKTTLCSSDLKLFQPRCNTVLKLCYFELNDKTIIHYRSAPTDFRPITGHKNNIVARRKFRYIDPSLQSIPRNVTLKSLAHTALSSYAFNTHDDCIKDSFEVKRVSYNTSRMTLRR